MKRHVLSLSLCGNPDGKNTITKKQNHCQSYLLLKAKGSTKPRNLNVIFLKMDCLIDFTVADAELKKRFRNSLDVK